MVFQHQYVVLYYHHLTDTDRQRISRRHVCNGLIEPIQIDRHLPDGQTLANLEQFCIRQEVGGGRLPQEVDVEVGRHGERHRPDRGKTATYMAKSASSIMVGPEMVP